MQSQTLGQQVVVLGTEYPMKLVEYPMLMIKSSHVGLVLYPPQTGVHPNQKLTRTHPLTPSQTGSYVCPLPLQTLILIQNQPTIQTLFVNLLYPLIHPQNHPFPFQTREVQLFGLSLFHPQPMIQVQSRRWNYKGVFWTQDVVCENKVQWRA